MGKALFWGRAYHRFGVEPHKTNENFLSARSAERDNKRHRRKKGGLGLIVAKIYERSIGKGWRILVSIRTLEFWVPGKKTRHWGKNAEVRLFVTPGGQPRDDEGGEPVRITSVPTTINPQTKQQKGEGRKGGKGYIENGELWSLKPGEKKGDGSEKGFTKL